MERSHSEAPLPSPTSTHAQCAVPPRHNQPLNYFSALESEQQLLHKGKAQSEPSKITQKEGAASTEASPKDAQTFDLLAEAARRAQLATVNGIQDKEMVHPRSLWVRTQGQCDKPRGTPNAKHLMKCLRY